MAPKTAQPAAKNAADHVFVGRQPILGRDREVCAYELLYRNQHSQLDATGNVATSRVLIHSLVNIGLDSVVGPYPAFINATEPLLMGPEIELFPPERVVFEILETIEPSPELTERIIQLKKNGFRFALDDFIYHPKWDSLLDEAQYVKIDVLNSPVESVAQLAPIKRPGMQLLAEKIETHEEFQRYMALGFDLFQGYFFCRPETLSSRATAANKLSIVRVLSALSDPVINTVQLAKLIGEDVTLCFQLLKLSNSAAVSRTRTVETIEDAIVRVGLDNIRHWTSLLLLTQGPNRKPHELLFTAMARARMCELLAQKEGVKNAGASFVAGLLSMADALLDQPFAELINAMPLSDQLRAGLLEHRNDIGQRLQQVLEYEQMVANGGTIRAGDKHLSRLRPIYFESLRWAQQLESRIATD